MRSRPGFSLIELMLVLVLIGILMLIVVPAFLGNTVKADDTRTQLAVVNIYTAIKSKYVASDEQSYGDTTTLINALQTEEPDFAFTDQPLSSVSNPYETISVQVTDGGQTVTLCAYSPSRRIFCLRANEQQQLRED